MEKLKYPNDEKLLTIIDVLNERLEGGAGERFVRDLVLLLCAKDIVQLVNTSFFKQLVGTIDVTTNELLHGMRSIYQMYPEPDFIRPHDYFSGMNILLNACNSMRAKDVKIIFASNDIYLPYIRDLLPDVYQDCPKSVKDMLCYANCVRSPTKGWFYELKNVLHDCISSYSEEDNADNCDVRCDIIQFIFTHAPRKLSTFYSLPMDLIMNHAPGKNEGSVVYAICGPSGGCCASSLQKFSLECTESGRKVHLILPWNPLRCVVRGSFTPHIISSDVKLSIKYDPDSIPSLHLIYFNCYHWGMDFFYRYMPHLVERRINKPCLNGRWMVPDVLKKKKATEQVGRHLFDAAKSSGILNNVFQLVATNRGQRIFSHVTLLDLYQIVLGEVRHLVWTILVRHVPGRFGPYMQSFDKAMETKFKQLRNEYDMKFFKEL